MRTIVCSTGEIANSYKDYLETNHWKKIREYVKYKRKCCKKCQTKERLEVHHKTYERLGNELLKDLVLLCRTCHQLTHDLKELPKEKNNRPKKQKREVIKTPKQLEMESRKANKSKAKKVSKEYKKKEKKVLTFQEMINKKYGL